MSFEFCTLHLKLLPMLKKLFSQSRLPYLSIAAACLIWGAASPIFKWSLTNIPVFTLAYFRFSIAALLLLPFVKNKLHIEKKDIPTVFFIGLTGITLNISFFFWGLEKTSSINSSIIIASEPLFIILFSIIFLKERPKKKLWLGILLSVIGFLIIIEKSLKGTNNGTLLGDLFILFATLAYVTQTIISKKIFEKYEAITITFWSFLVGTITFLPPFMYEALKPHWLENLNVQGIIGIAFGAFLSSAAAYFLYNWGIKQIEISKSAVFNYLNPVSGIIIAIPLLGEKITPSFLVGALLVFIGVYITQHPTNALQNQDEK